MAAREDIALMARYTADLARREELEALAAPGGGGYRDTVLAPHRSLIDLLEAYPACAMPFEVYLDRLPPLHPRYYSISSSARTSPGVCSVTVGVLRGPARSGGGQFTGVCSGYLDRNPERSTIFAFVRKPSIPFRPPDNAHVPMIMVGCGTGLAPFRGFIAERADLKAGGVPVGESLLFFGFRNPDQDYLYQDELRGYEEGNRQRQVAHGKQRLRTRMRIESEVLDAVDTVIRVVRMAKIDVFELCAQEGNRTHAGDEPLPRRKSLSLSWPGSPSPGLSLRTVE